MGVLWFVLVGFMLTAYVVLDGFDLGAGIIHLFAARTDQQRRLILRAIGPVWDGNEVWLIAAGGTIYFAFPTLYASSFSGFYLPLMIVLWLLMLRAIGIELRSHSSSQLWRDFFDFVFSVSSLLLAIFLGAALGNVIRGVPLNEEGYFFEPLWTTFKVSSQPGILDWYTVLTGLIALAVLTSHGSLYVATKTEGEVCERARFIGAVSWWLVGALTIIGLIATIYVQASVLENYKANPFGWLFPAIVGLSWASMFWFRARNNDKAAFVCSCSYIVGMLGGVAYATYPNLLPASTNPSWSITVSSAAAANYGLGVGLVWWTIGIAMALAYFVYLYRSFKGKVSVEGEGY